MSQIRLEQTARPLQVFPVLLTENGKLQQILCAQGILFKNTAWSLQGIWAGLSLQTSASDLPKASGCHVPYDSCSCAISSRWQQLPVWAGKVGTKMEGALFSSLHRDSSSAVEMLPTLDTTLVNLRGSYMEPVVSLLQLLCSIPHSF